ncbi:hypothetical protein DdX_12343 [Ditylenchus destructor]|uniref:Uncharacterized protein n=1 Tax=Ditylenchus destructor TaxID=166010 RepID=A0AAD4MXJ4_9BILA|nr:hypothetical protein DdX_12343 [Ditylenchus destructor]
MHILYIILTAYTALFLFLCLADSEYEHNLTFANGSKLTDMQTIENRRPQFGKRTDKPCNYGSCRKKTTPRARFKRSRKTTKPTKLSGKNDNRPTKAYNRLTKVVRGYVWQKDARARESRPPRLSRCMSQRCRSPGICRSMGGKCRYCNLVTRRCTIYAKLARGKACSNDRECTIRNVCDVPKSQTLLNDRKPKVPKCVLQENVEHKIEYQQRPGDLSPYTPRDIERMRNEDPNRKWPDPSTYYTPQTISRHRKLFTQDPNGASFLVRMPGVRRDLVAFKLEETFEKILKQSRPDGIPVIPGREMNKYIHSDRQNFTVLKKKFASILVNLESRPDPNLVEPEVLIRIDINPKHIRGVRMRSGNEPWADPDQFKVGGLTEGDTGAPEAIINLPPQINMNHYMKNNIRSGHSKWEPGSPGENLTFAYNPLYNP